jgi:hypothetical protein
MNRKVRDIDPIVTQSYLSKALEPYVTKDYLDEKLEPYVTKDYLDERLSRQSREFERFCQSLSEDFQHKIEQVLEGIILKIDSIEKGMRERDVWLSNHEDRILKLEA